MGIRDISFGRSLGSYARLQRVVASVIRGRRFQLRSRRLREKAYLDVGCGPNTHDEFINLEYSWHPGIDLCWDISRGIPLRSGSMKGIFTEHCLEHFSLPTVRFVLGEFRRLLAPGGVVRIIVPDAGAYLTTYVRRVEGSSNEQFPYEDSDREAGLKAPLISVNRVFYVDRDSVAGHRSMFDEYLMRELIDEAGFGNIQRTAFREGINPTLLIDTEFRRVESLYMEASVAG